MNTNDSTLRIVLLQTNPAWLDTEANIATAEDLITRHAGADLYVLPEMWATGFSTREAHPAPEAHEWMVETARSRGVAIVGSLPIEEGGKNYNRFYFVTPEAEYHYDKCHLFSYGGEDKHFSAGRKRVIVEWRGFRFLLAMCYDLRFPVFLRNRNDYDILLHVACWPDIRRSAYDTLLAARAIENLCYVVSVNRTGREVFTGYDGGSRIVGPEGNVLCSLGAEPDVAQTVLSLSALRAYRHRFPFLSDADDFSLEI